jgi:predicted alpha/beta hydrolase family esterase
MNLNVGRFRVLIVPGLHGRGPDHWQTRWQQIHPKFERVEQVDWDRPDIIAWSEQINKTLRRSVRPTIIAAHSFGCLATVHRAIMGAPHLYGALLVAPADPKKFGVEAQLAHALSPLAAAVVASDNDPWMDTRRAEWWAVQWHARFITAGTIGHINAESGIGDWRAGLDQLELLAQRIAVPRRCGCATQSTHDEPAPGQQA